MLEVEPLFVDSIPPSPPTTGLLYAWGYNGVFGELGINIASVDDFPLPYSVFSSPVQVGTLNTWSVLTPGWDHSQAVIGGKAYAWGSNNNSFPTPFDGQLGLNLSQFGVSSPVQIGSGTDWVKTAAGAHHAMGIRGSGGIGKLYTWGNNASGQLAHGDHGDGAGNQVGYLSSPVQVGTRTDFVDCAASAHFSHFITGDGKLWTAGENDFGQGGVGHLTPSIYGFSSPVQVGSDSNWVRLVPVKNVTAFAFRNDGTLWGWGANIYGDLGVPGFPVGVAQPSPVQIGPDKSWLKAIVGYNHVLALTSDGLLWTWGGNTWGQLGFGDTVLRSSPTQVGGNIWTDIAAGWGHSAALTKSGKIYTWGRNDYGELGLGDNLHRSSPVQVGTSNKWIKIFAGIYTMFAIRSS